MKADMALKVCQKCRAACCKMGGVDFTGEEMRRVLKAGYKNCFEKIGRNHYELKSKKGVCPYLSKNGSCVIHRIRPLACRCWPVHVKFKKDRRELVLVECPLTSYLSAADIAEMSKLARKIPTNMTKMIFPSSHLPKSDLKIIKKRLRRFKGEIVR